MFQTAHGKNPGSENWRVLKSKAFKIGALLMIPVCPSLILCLLYLGIRSSEISMCAPLSHAERFGKMFWSQSKNAKKCFNLQHPCCHMVSTCVNSPTELTQPASTRHVHPCPGSLSASPSSKLICSEVVALQGFHRKAAEVAKKPPAKLQMDHLGPPQGIRVKPGSHSKAKRADPRMAPTKPQNTLQKPFLVTSKES